MTKRRRGKRVKRKVKLCVCAHLGVIGDPPNTDLLENSPT